VPSSPRPRVTEAPEVGRRAEREHGSPRTPLASLARMAARVHHDDDFAADLLADERVRRIDWSHPTLAPLSDPARLIYASLIDAGLLLLLDERTISGGWVRRPWEGPPS
jgi:hypothetical protein